MSSPRKTVSDQCAFGRHEACRGYGQYGSRGSFSCQCRDGAHTRGHKNKVIG